MKYLLIILMLFSSCSLFRKSVNQEQHEVKKSNLLLKDSSGSLLTEEVKKLDLSQWGVTTTDSGYDKITEVTIQEVIDSGHIRRETKRVIKERGNKRVEHSFVTMLNDSTAKKANQSAAVKQLQKQDSTAVTIKKKKDVARDSLMPWWLWLIVLIAVAFGWWKRNSIIEYLWPS